MGKNGSDGRNGRDGRRGDNAFMNEYVRRSLTGKSGRNGIK